MSFQSCHLLFPVIWEFAKDSPEGRLHYLNASWARLVGPQLAQKTRPDTFLGDTVVIAVSSVAWRRELEEMSAVLLCRINETCGECGVQRVEFKVGKIVPDVRPAAAVRKLLVPLPPSKPRQALDGIGAEIMDEGLKETFAAAAAKNLMLRGY